MNIAFVAVLFVVVFTNRCCSSYFITVEGHTEECFFETVAKGFNVALTFEVAEGGFLDIDLEVTGPSEEILHKGHKETNGKYTFTASKEGVFKVCFNNMMSAMTPKIIMFSIDAGEPVKPASDDNDSDVEHQEKLQNMINELSTVMIGVKHEQEYMEVRERIHRAVNDNTNSRVVLWALFESLVLAVMTVGQIFYLKRFFEVKRLI